MSSEIAVLNQAEKEALLSPRELREYQIYMRLKQPPMAQSTQLQFFNLFMNGQSCEDIVRLNPNGFSLGAIVRARLENNWDQHLAEHKQELMYRVRDRVQQVALETAERLANEMAASNKLINDRVLKYIQTGDVAELKDTSVGSIRHLQQTIEMLAKLTGADQPKKPQTPPAQVNVNIGGPGPTVVEGTVLPAVPVGKPLPAKTAATALESILKARQK